MHINEFHLHFKWRFKQNIAQESGHIGLEASLLGGGGEIDINLMFKLIKQTMELQKLN